MKQKNKNKKNKIFVQRELQTKIVLSVLYRIQIQNTPTLRHHKWKTTTTTTIIIIIIDLII